MQSGPPHAALQENTIMHQLLKAHLEAFSEENSLQSKPVPKQFEHFVAFCALSKSYVGRTTFDNIVTDETEAGIDSVAFVIDEELITTPEEATELFKSHRRNREVEITFTQAKSGDSFDRGDILKFGDAVVDFFREKKQLPLGYVLQNAYDIFSVVLKNVNKVAGGKPTCNLFYATAGKWTDATELRGTLNSIEYSLHQSGLFSKVKADPLDRDALLTLWSRSRQSVEAKVSVSQYFPFPQIEGVNEAYLALIPAREFVEKVIRDEQGNIRTNVFQENIRAFLGDDNPVNKGIVETLTQPDKSKDRFCILNNGVTIVAGDIRVQAGFMHLQDYQIVNGCQTSHILSRHVDVLGDNVFITARLIEAEKQEVVSQIVRATNSQSKVDTTQFVSLRPIVRRIEEYLESIDPTSDKAKVYLARREKQYTGMGIAETRILDTRTLARAYASMFLDHPHLAARYPTQIFKELSGQVYQEEHQEVAYYTSALGFYRLNLLFFGGILPANLMKCKWHILMGFKYLASREKIPSPSSKKMEAYCAKIQGKLLNQKGSGVELFKQICELLVQLGVDDRDRLRSVQFTAEFKQRLIGEAQRNV